jgi:hypothetical protein
LAAAAKTLDAITDGAWQKFIRDRELESTVS